MGFAEKDFHTAITNMFKGLEEIMNIIGKERHKKESIGNFRT